MSLSSMRKHDEIFGGAGDDDMQGNAGNDSLSGNDGDDWMDALEECEKLAKRLKQLEKPASTSAQPS